MNAPEAQPVLRLAGVSQQYGTGPSAVLALAGVDLDVHAGELVAIMGASGSGKSTLLSIAAACSGRPRARCSSEPPPWPWIGLLALGVPIVVTAVAWLVPPGRPAAIRRAAIA